MYGCQRMNTCGRIVLGLAITCCPMAHAQENPVPLQRLPPIAPASPMPEVTQVSPVAPCLQPPPIVRWQDYQGPLQKVVGAFGRRLERKSVGTVGSPYYKPGAVLCSLTLKGKLLLFVEDSFDPVTFLGVAFNAGLDQAEDTTPKFGQGAAGYGKRFGANFAGSASSEFFKDVVYSEIFREDPRYYRLAHGSGKRRFFHALEHAVVARRENGASGFNFSEWLGTTSAVALSYTYRPGAETGVGPAAESIVSAIAQDAGFDVLREFWPEIAHKFKLPFRNEYPPQGPALTPSAPSGAR